MHEGHIVQTLGKERFRVVQFCSAICERDFFGYSMSDDEEPDDEEYECWPPIHSKKPIHSGPPPKEDGDTLYVD